MEDSDEDEKPERFVEISSDLTPGIGTVGLHMPLVHALGRRGVSRLFPVQAAVIPWILAAERSQHLGDMCVCAPTGSGKTLAYVLPLVHMLKPLHMQVLRAIVVLPTRSLALQVRDVFNSIGSLIGVRVGSVLGDVPFVAEKAQFAEAPASNELGSPFTGGVDVVVATPGRLVDHLRAGTMPLASVRWLVLDEADRLMAQAYHEWLPIVSDALGLPGRPQFARTRWEPRGARAPSSSVPARVLLFSATLGSTAHLKAGLALLRPTLIRVGSKAEAMPTSLTERCVVTALELKPLALYALLRAHHGEVPAGGRALVFTRSVDAAHRLTRLLQVMAVDAREFTSNLSHHDREEVLAAFAAGTCRVIVASDAVARGVDFQHTQLVVNYDIPAKTKTYVHRAGRTARAGATGTCVTILTADQEKHFRRMLARLSRQPVALDVGPLITDGPRAGEDASSDDEVQDLPLARAVYDAKLAALAHVLDRERREEIKSHVPLSGQRKAAPGPERQKGAKRSRDHLLAAGLREAMRRRAGRGAEGKVARIS